MRWPCRGDGGDLVVLHVEQVKGCAHHEEGKGEGERSEDGNVKQPFEDTMRSWLRRWKVIEKRGIESDATPWKSTTGRRL